MASGKRKGQFISVSSGCDELFSNTHNGYLFLKPICTHDTHDAWFKNFVYRDTTGFSDACSGNTVKKLFTIIIYCHMTYTKGAKHLCTTAAANALAIHLRQRGLEKNRWNFMIWAVFFCRKHMHAGIYIHIQMKEELISMKFPKSERTQVQRNATVILKQILLTTLSKKERCRIRKVTNFFVYVDPDQTLSNPSRSNCI